MLLRREDQENRRVILTIQVEQEAWTQALEDAYQRTRTLFTQPDGSIPTRQELEEKHGADTFYQEAVNSTYPVALVEAVSGEGLSVAGAPELKVESIGPEGFTFSAHIELYPEVKLGQYKGLSASCPKAELSDDDIAAAMGRFRQEHARQEHPEKAAMGDEVILDFEGFLDGKPFDGGKAEQYPLLLGSGYFIPGFEEQVAGMAPGDERDISVTFPQAYAPELAGKDAVFHIRVHDVTRTVLPELDDALAQEEGFADADALRRSITAHAMKEKQQQAQNDYADALISQVVKGMEVDIPDSMVQNQLDSLMQGLEQQLADQGATLNDYLGATGLTREQLRRQVEGSARASVEFDLAMTAIANQEGLTVTDEELDRQYRQMAPAYGMSEDQLREALPPERLRHDLRLARARALVVDSGIPQ